MEKQLSAEIDAVRQTLIERAKTTHEPGALLKSPELRSLFERIPKLPQNQRAEFGRAANELRQELSRLDASDEAGSRGSLDVSAPFTPGTALSDITLLPASLGSVHPLNAEIKIITSIFLSMGFSIIEPREIDDDWHMFTSLNFPLDHPARDDYDTFVTEQIDQEGKPWVAPAHTSTMQSRVLSRFKSELEAGRPLAAVIPGRVFRNEDVDPRHEHTFYQLEGLYVSENVSIGNLLATLKSFLESYYQKQIMVKTQPFYFPFTEPSLEFAMSCPFCEQRGCSICSKSGWIELIGCGMIHPNVFKLADIDPHRFKGFAWGGGIERMVMMKDNIEDVRLFESGRLDFLRQFSAGGNS